MFAKKFKSCLNSTLFLPIILCKHPIPVQGIRTLRFFSIKYLLTAVHAFFGDQHRRSFLFSITIAIAQMHTKNTLTQKISANPGSKKIVSLSTRKITEFCCDVDSGRERSMLLSLFNCRIYKKDGGD